jgi:hypothetical protein
MSVTQAQLQEQIAALDRDLAAINADYAALVAKLAMGDKNALRQADALDQKRTVLIRSKAMNLAAGGLLEQRRVEEESEAQQAENRKRILEAREIASQIAALHTGLDSKLVELRQALETRVALLRVLASTGQCDATFLNKLLCKPAATRSFCFARLHDHVAMEVPASSSFAPLSSSNTVLLAIGKDVAAEPGVTRRPLNGG